LAAKFNPACLLLISPIKSVKDAARVLYGRVADYFIEERFDNFNVAKRVQCPTAIFHGINDRMVPFQHSMEMLLNGFIQAKTHMFLRDGMEHNRLDYINDIIKPMRYFLKLN
jgi:abhydrolase domain-containing protein 17